MKSPRVAASKIRTQVWPMALLLTALIASAPAFAAFERDLLEAHPHD